MPDRSCQPTDERTKVAAARELIDRGYGKSAQPVVGTLTARGPRITGTGPNNALLALDRIPDGFNPALKRNWAAKNKGVRGEFFWQQYNHLDDDGKIAEGTEPFYGEMCLITIIGVL